MRMLQTADLALYHKNKRNHAVTKEATPKSSVIARSATTKQSILSVWRLPRAYALAMTATLFPKSIIPKKKSA